MKQSFTRILAALFAIVISCSACTKFLDQKPDQKLATPSGINDLQSVLDYYFTMILTPGAVKMASDEYYMLPDVLNAVPNEWDKDVYLWQPTVMLDNDWNASYKLVFYANTVLDNLPVKNIADSVAWNNVKGSALFYRAWGFYQVSQLFCKAYYSTTAATDAGIPLRLDADFEKASSRSSVQQAYEQMLSDLETAIPLLPEMPAYLIRPSKAAAYALKGRIEMLRGDYTAARSSTDAALACYNYLVNYNSLNTSASNAFVGTSKEVILYTYNNSVALTQSRVRMDSNLLRSYHSSDLRFKVLYRDNGNGSFSFKGSYTGSTSSQTFSGIATDELYLNLAECACRLHDVNGALQSLNKLLENRWKTGSFVPLTMQNESQLLDSILVERKRELVFRGTRWTDIRRLNSQGASISLTRLVNGQTYQLPANDKRFVMKIPQKVIDLTTMPQNE